MERNAAWHSALRSLCGGARAGFAGRWRKGGVGRWREGVGGRQVARGRCGSVARGRGGRQVARGGYRWVVLRWGWVRGVARTKRYRALVDRRDRRAAFVVHRLHRGDSAMRNMRWVRTVSGNRQGVGEKTGVRSGALGGEWGAQGVRTTREPGQCRQRCIAISYRSRSARCCRDCKYSGAVVLKTC